MNPYSHRRVDSSPQAKSLRSECAPRRRPRWFGFFLMALLCGFVAVLPSAHSEEAPTAATNPSANGATSAGAALPKDSGADPPVDKRTPLEKETRFSLIAPSPDGSLLASFRHYRDRKKQWKREVTVWDLTTGESTRTLSAPHDCVSLALSPDNRFVASIGGQRKTIGIWEISTGKRLVNQPTSGIYTPRLAFSSDSRHLFVSLYIGFLLVDVETGEARQDTARSSHVTDIDCSPTDPNVFGVAAWSRIGSSIQIWNLETLQVEQAFSVPGRAVAVGFSNDGSRIAGASDVDQPVFVWDAKTGKQIVRFKPIPGKIGEVEFAPDLRSLIFLRIKRGRAPRILLDLESGAESLLEGRGRYLATGHVVVPSSKRGTVFFDPKNKEFVPLATLSPMIAKVAAAKRRRLAPTIPVRPIPARRQTLVLGDVQVDEVIHVAHNETKTFADRSRVARFGVLDFEDADLPVDAEVRGATFGSMLVSDLSGLPGLQLVERSATGELLRETSLEEAGLTARGGDRDAARSGADFLLSGSLRRNDKRLSLEVALHAVADKRSAAEWTLAAKPKDVLAIEARLVELLRKYFETADSPTNPGSVAPLAEDADRPTIAVLPFRNLTADAEQDDLRRGLAELLQANLSLLADVPLVERERLETLMREQSLSASGLVDSESAARLGQLLLAERLLAGEFLRLGNVLRLQTRLIDTSSGAVLATEQVQGPDDDFAGLLEDLTAALCVNLEVSVPPDVREEMRSAMPVNRLESAIHYVRGNRLFRSGQPLEAARSLEQALLVEPKNIYVHVARTHALYSARQWEPLVAAGQDALRQKYNPGQRAMRGDLYRWLRKAFSELNRRDEYAPYAKRYTKEFRTSLPKSVGDYHTAIELLRAGKYEAASELLLQLTSRPENAEKPWIADALFNLYYANRKVVRSKRKPRLSREEAIARCETADAAVRRGFDLFRRYSRYPRTFLGFMIPGSLDLKYRNDRGKLVSYYTTDQRVSLLRHSHKANRYSHTRWLTQFEIAKEFEKGERWQEAIDSYQALLDLDGAKIGWSYQGSWSDRLPCRYDMFFTDLRGWDPTRIEATYRIGELLEWQGKSDEAQAQYGAFLREFGAVNFAAPNVLQAVSPEAIPIDDDRSALVWGGGSDSRRAWNGILTPLGYRVHGVWLEQVTAAQLAPYRLVVLVRSGRKAYTPTELLALRSYVATGGSLLVVLSSGWEASAPSLHDGLLEFFGMTTSRDLTVRARSTFIKPHPITKGIDAAMAKTACGLRAPEESSLIRHGDESLLAATDYGRGRVVVATFGQWLLPDIRVLGRWWRNTRSGYHSTSHLPQSDLPIEPNGAGMQRPLLDNVLAWLDEPVLQAEDLAHRRRLLEACAVVRSAQAEVVSWSEMKSALSRLVDSTSTDFWKEEYLWAAGEALQQLVYFPSGRHLRWPTYREVDVEGFGADPEFYRRLVAQFPASPLRPYAQWRVGECARRVSSTRTERRRGKFYDREPTVARPLYEAVDAEPGTHAWAWTRLRLGNGWGVNAEYERAGRYYQEVADGMPLGPERSMALLNLARVRSKAGAEAEAGRVARSVLSMPDIYFSMRGDHTAKWTPLPTMSRTGHRTSHSWARRLVGDADKEEQKP